MSSSGASASASKSPEDILAELAVSVEKQGAAVRTIKGAIKTGGPKAPDAAEKQEELKAAVEKLKALKAEFAAMNKKVNPSMEINQGALDSLCKRRFFYGPSFDLYGGVSGLYDYGPNGCALQANMLSEWRQHFILEEDMLEIDNTIVTPDYVLRASGHEERFHDFIVRDVATGNCHRADHILEDFMEALLKDPKCPTDKRAEYEQHKREADNYSLEEIGAILKKYDVRAPDTGNELSDPAEFNMMFSTAIGPAGDLKGYLRPETAQGIFVNFKKLYEYNYQKLPFAGAHVGKAFRNEIAPRGGLIRVREFTMAEIEHFLDPEDKSHPKIGNVADIEVPFWSACDQMDGKSLSKMTIREALDKKVVGNESHAYFIGRIYQYLVRVGIDPTKVRFRQHMSNEMAHYAEGCWDAECLTSYGWIECVGCADRSCYDLTCHSKATGIDLVARTELKEPIIEDVLAANPVKKLMGKAFRKDGKLVMGHLESMGSEEVAKLQEQLSSGPATLKIDGREFTLEPAMVEIKQETRKQFVRTFTPGVIEPSFGIGRILYAILEHSFQVRNGDEQRGWLKFAPCVAPVKCSLIPLILKEEYMPFITSLKASLTKLGVSSKIDKTNINIGKRYARTDEIGIPFGITVDDKTPASNQATLRDRDTMNQVRAPIDEIPQLVYDLVHGNKTWADLEAKYEKITK